MEKKLNRELLENNLKKELEESYIKAGLDKVILNKWMDSEGNWLAFKRNKLKLK